jgi:hypothetical protein
MQKPFINASFIWGLADFYISEKTYQAFLKKRQFGKGNFGGKKITLQKSEFTLQRRLWLKNWKILNFINKNAHYLINYPL